MSEHELIRKGMIFILMGPAGSGKTTLCRRLLTDFADTLNYTVSATSRSPRKEEEEGKSYHFFSQDEFRRKIERGEFFEWEETHGNLYGTLRESLSEGIQGGKDLLFQIDIRGALNFKRAFPDNTVTVFILPPSFDELKRRLLRRGTNDPEELARRFKTATQEYETLLKMVGNLGNIDYLLVNKSLDETYEKLRAIVVSERSKFHRIDIESIQRFCRVHDYD